MHKIGFLGLKGGTGKTMLATQIAVRAHDNYNKPALVDLDPTAGGSTLWHRHRTEEGNRTSPDFLVGVSDPETAIERAELAGYDFLCLDGPPGATDTTRICAALCDVSVVPVRCSSDDLERAALAATLCQSAGCKHTIFAINDVPMKSAGQKYEQSLAAEIKQELEEEGFSTVIICHRSHFIRARNAGLGVGEISGRGIAEARKEIEELYLNIIKGLGYEGIEKSHA